jgi:GNAT superfamily N-acetyltransferase
VYPDSPPWSGAQLESHLQVFPEGQFVAVESASGLVVGMAASLILQWDDYEVRASWRDFTDSGLFTNHDPTGTTLYGAEVMVDPSMRRMGIGKKIYAARRDLARRLRLRRIRAGARLRGYHRYAAEMSADEYVLRVVRGEIADPTLTFQLRERFRVMAVIPDYLGNDPESLGWAALIEWINHQVARPRDYAARDRRFLISRKDPDRSSPHKQRFSGEPARRKK